MIFVSWLTIKIIFVPSKGSVPERIYEKSNFFLPHKKHNFYNKYLYKPDQVISLQGQCLIPQV